MNNLVRGGHNGKVVVVSAAITFLMTVVFPAVYGVVYKVGDSAGWTTIGHVDYKQWAATKTFRLGDVIVFQYSPQFHNVMQVTHPAYQACNASSPIATHTTGNDTILITKHGHYFFLCGVPGHCQSGQKVDIHLIKPVTAPSPASIVASSPANAVAAASPGPSSYDASSSWSLSNLLICVILVGMGVFLPFF